MKTVKPAKPSSTSSNPSRDVIREELEAMRRVFAIAMRSPEDAKALLYRTGIIDKSGKLAKAYR